MTTLGTQLERLSLLGRIRVLLILALFGVCSGLGFLGAQGQGQLIIGATVGILLLLLMLRWPRVATIALLFVMFLNIPVVLIRYQNVPSFVAQVVPLVLILPLTSYMLFRRERIVFDRGFALMFGFLGVQVVSTLFAYDMDVALAAVTQYVIEGLVLYFLLVNVIRDEQGLRQCVWAIVVAAAIMSTIVLYQELTHTYKDVYGGFAQRIGSFEQTADVWQDRPAGPIGEPNYFAQILLMAVPLGLFRFSRERALALRTLALACTVLSIMGVVVTYSRGAAIALLLLGLVIAYLWKIKPHYLLIGLVGLVLLVSVVAPNYVNRVASIGDAQGFVSQDGGQPKDKSIRGRAAENLAAIAVFLDYPLLGSGPGNFLKLYPFYVEDTGYYVQHNTEERPAHNLYLNIAADVGLVGLVVFLAIVGVQIGRLLRIRSRHPDQGSEIVSLATSTLLSLLAYLFAGLFLSLAYQRYFWILIALISATTLISEAQLRGQQQRSLTTTSNSR
jgi:putative inorganic carbon (hco3(-)) transporter